MNISRAWLQTFFDAPLPEAQALAEALTFHAFEIESVTDVGCTKSHMDAVLDVKVTPNRGHDCLCHRGIAKELSAILNIPLNKKYGFTKPIDLKPIHLEPKLEPKTDFVKVTIEDARLCPRFTGAYIRNVKVGPSPEWLRTALESVGQKSINNIVDATNYVMFNIGQPLHAFDVGKLKRADSYALNVRLAKKGERLMGLDDKEYELSPSMLAIEDAHAKQVVSIAGIKGGKPTGIDEGTSDMFLEAANWDGVTIRKTSQALKLRTDASDRFQQVISPELAVYGMYAAAELIREIAGGEIVGYVDEYPLPPKRRTVGVSTEKINKILGTSLSESDVEDAFRRLDLSFEQKGGEFIVSIPFERLDLQIPEDLVEEVGRIVGYDTVPSEELPAAAVSAIVSPSFYAAEKNREELMAAGYSEVYTSVFADAGERAVANKTGGERPYMRTTLLPGLREALERNRRHADLLGLRKVRLFEIGAVWKGGREVTMVGTVDETGEAKEWPLAPSESSSYDDLPISHTERYAPFSRYPSITRDIAMWVPEQTPPEAVLAVIRSNAGEWLMRADLFDSFKKGERTSYAFRLVFQSFEKTLTDAEVNERMSVVSVALKAHEFEIR